LETGSESGFLRAVAYGTRPIGFSWKRLGLPGLERNPRAKGGQSRLGLTPFVVYGAGDPAAPPLKPGVSPLSGGERWF